MSSSSSNLLEISTLSSRSQLLLHRRSAIEPLSWSPDDLQSRCLRMTTITARIRMPRINYIRGDPSGPGPSLARLRDWPEQPQAALQRHPSSTRWIGLDWIMPHALLWMRHRRPARSTDRAGRGNGSDHDQDLDPPLADLRTGTPPTVSSFQWRYHKTISMWDFLTDRFRPTGPHVSVFGGGHIIYYSPIRLDTRHIWVDSIHSRLASTRPVIQWLGWTRYKGRSPSKAFSPSPRQQDLFPLLFSDRNIFSLVSLPSTKKTPSNIPSRIQPTMCRQMTEGVTHPTCGHYSATKLLAILDCSQRQCRLSSSHPKHCHPCRCERYYGPDDERNRGKAPGYCPDCIRQSEVNGRSRH